MMQLIINIVLLNYKKQKKKEKKRVSIALTNI